MKYLSPFIGLWWYIQSVRSGFESKLAGLITRMTWSSKQRRLYIVLTFPFILFAAAEQAAQIGILREARNVRWSWSYYLLHDIANFSQSVIDLGGLLLAVVIGAGIRRFLSAPAYMLELRATPNNRTELFQACMASYFPFLLFLYFVAEPLGRVFGIFLMGEFQVSDLLLNYFVLMILGTTADSQQLISSPDGMGLFFLIVSAKFFGFLAFILFFFVKVFLIVRAKGLLGGVVSAIIVSTILSAFYEYARFRAAMEFAPYVRYGYNGPSDWRILIPELLPLLFLGIIWYKAQRRYERGLLPTEGEN